MHHDATSVPLDLQTDDLAQGSEKIPAVSASASTDAQGRVHVGLVNLDPRAAVAVQATLRGRMFASVTGRILTADTLDAHNTVDAPSCVQPATFTGATLHDSVLQARPPRSVVVLTLAAGPS